MRLPATIFRRRRDDLTLGLPAGVTYRFPDGFLWGAATSSHQVEGANERSDWWRFERIDGKARQFHSFPVEAQRYKSDHWRRFSEDIAMMHADLGLTSYRFSLEWSRIEPEPGRFDQSVIDRYAQMCAQMRERGITPMVTLFHWSSPDWIWDHDREHSTGWYAAEIVENFERFCAQVVPALAPYVDMFVTINEPNVFLYGGFAEGILAPGHRETDEALLTVQRNLLHCHVAAYRTIKTINPAAQVGLAHHYCPFEPYCNWNPLEAWVAGRVEQGFTWAFPDAIRDGAFTFAIRRAGRPRFYTEQVPNLKGTADFTGVNFYERMLVKVPAAVRLSRMTVLNDHQGDKAIWPKGIHTRRFVDVLQEVHGRYQLPIYVTENGQAHTNDDCRRLFIRQHLRALGYAVDQLGIDVRGYYYWSLLDNQEWAHGFLPRLGLYAVDYKTGQRELRQSARTYAQIIADGCVTC